MRHLHDSSLAAQSIPQFSVAIPNKGRHASGALVNDPIRV